MATTTIPRDIELQEPFQVRGRSPVPATESDELEGYGDTSNQIWKLYGTESERHDKALVDSWKSNTDSMLIFTGLFSSIVASFLIETYKTLLPDNASQTVSLLTQLVAQSNGTAIISSQTSVQQSVTPSAIRVNVLMFLSLFFSVTSALVSTLIQQWGHEYLQYSQPSAAPHKRGRVRAYLFDGLSQFQVRRLTYGVPVLLHLGVFFFFFAISEWLYPISVPVGATARYCLVALFTMYMALSVLPLIVTNAPYQTALTTPLRASISLIHVSYLVLLRLVGRSSEVDEAPKDYGLFRSVHVDRAQALMNEIKRRAPKLDRSAMHWLLQKFDKDDMGPFLRGFPGYIHSPLTDTKLVVEGLRKDEIPLRIRQHLKTCVTSVELSPEQSMSRASSCINSLRLISETSANTPVSRPGSENDEIQAIMKYLEPLYSDSKTRLRASCIRSLVIREFLFPLAHTNDEDSLRKKFLNYSSSLYRVIHVWKTTEIAQWSHITGASAATADPLPNDQQMWADILCDGPLINLAAFAYAVLSHSSEGEVNLDMAWKTLETLLKGLDLGQVRASSPARARFDQVLLMARARVSKYKGGREHTQITPLLEALDTVTSGLYLAEVFAYLPNTKLLPRQIEAIFGKEQLRDSELLTAFAAHLPGFVGSSGPETSRSYMERLIIENKLWEQLHVSLLKCFHRHVPFPDKLRIIVAFFDILDVAFEVLKDSSKTDWQSPHFDLLIGHLSDFQLKVAPGKLIGRATIFRINYTSVQLWHALLAQFAMQHSCGEPLFMSSLHGLRRLIGVLGLGTEEDRKYFTDENAETSPDLMNRAEEILSSTLRDGPLSNFCKLGRLTFEEMLNQSSDLSEEDKKRPWTMFRRMLDTPHLSLVNASRGMWVKFDHLRATVRGTVALKGGGQYGEKLQPLLEMIEKINRMRPTADDRSEGTGNQPPASVSVIQDARQPSETSTPGSSRRAKAEAPYAVTGSGSPMDPTHFPPVRGVIPMAEMNQFAHGACVPHIEADPNAIGPGQPSILTGFPGPGGGIPHQPLAVPTGIPVPPGYTTGHHYPPPFPNPGPLGVPPLGHVNQGSPFPMHGPGGYPTPGSNYEGDDSGDE